MRIDPELLAKARARPDALSFEEAVRLTRQLGFEKVRQVARHRIFRRAGREHRLFSLQEGRGGKAKAYQVEQLLEGTPPPPRPHRHSER
jgi:hypothetical protein